MKKITITLLLLIGILSLIALPCIAAEGKGETPGKTETKPAMGKKMVKKMAAVKAPVVKLDRIEIANYWGFFLDPKEKRGAVLNLGFVFSMENPNKKDVMLSDMKFTVAFEEFELNTITYFEEDYIPARKTDHLKVNGAFDAYTAMLSLLVTNGHKLQEMNVKAPDLLKKWWEGISDFNFPITVNGTATFVGPDGKNIIVPFEETFPQKK